MNIKSPEPRFLILKMWAMGDIVMTTPLVHALKEAYPGCRITWMADTPHAGILEDHPEIDELITIDSRRWRESLRKGNVLGWILQVFKLRRSLKKLRFDVAINCHVDKRWAKLLCVAPEKIGLGYAKSAPSYAHGVYDLLILAPDAIPVHPAQHCLKVVEAFGVSPGPPLMSLGMRDVDGDLFRAFAERNGLREDRSFVLFAPFGSSENKSLSYTTCKSLAAWIQADLGLDAVAAGLAKHGDQARQTCGRCAIGEPLPTLMAIMRRATLVVCCDSAALHIAAAVGTPYLALFGPTDPASSAPLQGEGQILYRKISCSPCFSSSCTNPVFRECIEQLSLPELQEKILELTGKSRLTA